MALGCEEYGMRGRKKEVREGYGREEGGGEKEKEGRRRERRGGKPNTGKDVWGGSGAMT